MKKISLALVLNLALVLPSTAQITVSDEGNVGIKVTNIPINSSFSINSSGDSKVCANILSEDTSFDTGLLITKKGTPTTSNDYTKGISINTTASANSMKKIFGAYTSALKEGGDGNGGRTYGLYSIAGNASNGYNYGVFGTLAGSKNGAGVYGSSVSWDGGVNTMGRYAGYFHGNVLSTDAMFATAFVVSSDYKLKENIKSLDSRSSDDIMKLNVVKYNFKKNITKATDTTSVLNDYYIDDSKILNREHYGLIAQEIQEIYPELVYERSDGYLAVNYIEIIPLLIKSIQDLKTELNELKNNTPNSPIRSEETTKTNKSVLPTVLYQNTPNPFTENTTIGCFIPKETTKAILYIYDMNGKQINEMNISERGKVSLTIEGYSLEAGIYLYSLIADGQVIDTKRMILTK